MKKENTRRFKFNRRHLSNYLRKNQTEAECILWKAIRHKQIENCRFRRQSPIAYYIVDFYSPAAKLVIEVDGNIHEHFQEADSIRDKVLSELGLTVIRFTNDEIIDNVDQVLEKLRNYLENASY